MANHRLLAISTPTFRQPWDPNNTYHAKTKGGTCNLRKAVASLIQSGACAESAPTHFIINAFHCSFRLGADASLRFGLALYDDDSFTSSFGRGATIAERSRELKLRRLWSSKGLNDVRLEIQKASATECERWQVEVGTGKWAGRLLVLARWQTLAAEGDPEIRIDYVPRDCSPRGFSGWFGTGKHSKPCQQRSDHRHLHWYPRRCLEPLRNLPQRPSERRGRALP